MIPDTRRALYVILAQRVWQAASGLMTIALVTHFLTPEQQGWYYSLLSIAALYTLFDLGLSYVLVQAAAHMFVTLHWRPRGDVEGSAGDRFAALVAWSIRHYFWLTLGFALLVAPGGFIFFATTGSTAVSWQPPWLALALASSTALLLLPFLAIVEGSGLVAEVYAVRLAQGVVGAVACWIALVAGSGLWAIVMAPASAVAVQAMWLLARRPGLLSLARHGRPGQINWRQEIWPHQWQIGLGWLGGYLLTQAYIPILFKTQGAVAAGQMGLSLTISNMLGLLALSWITRRVPAMASAVAARRWDQLDQVFRRDAILSCAAFLGGAAVILILDRALSGSAIADRVLPFWSLAGLLAAGFLGHVQGCLAAQLRSFRREPLVWVSLIGAVLTATCALWAGLHYSTAGVVTAMLTIQLVVILPASILIWRHRNRDWRLPLGSDSPSSDHRYSDLEPVVLPRLDA